MNVCNEPGCNRRCGDERAMCDKHTRLAITAAFGRAVRAPGRGEDPVDSPSRVLASPPPAVRPSRFEDSLLLSGGRATE